MATMRLHGCMFVRWLVVLLAVMWALNVAPSQTTRIAIGSKAVLSLPAMLFEHPAPDASGELPNLQFVDARLEFVVDRTLLRRGVTPFPSPQTTSVKLQI